VANRFRGEALITGEQKTYLLRLGTRELCRLMDEFQEPTDAAVLQRIGKELSPEGQQGINTRVLVKVVQATVELANENGAAYDLIDDCGVEAVIDALSAAVHGRTSGGVVPPPKSARKKKSLSSGPSDLPTPPK
jgi:hypothetical protein